MSGIPPNPKDKHEYGDILLGAPLVLEYDAKTGGYKLVTNPAPDESALDAFGRSRVSNPETLFDGQFNYTAQPLLWYSRTTGSASVAHLADQGAVRLRAAANSEVTHQTKRYFQYQAGKSQLVQLTGLFPTAQDAVARAGYFDDSNGLFFQVADGAASFVLRSSVSGAVVETVVPQVSWNIDKFDGTGPPGIVLDLSQGQNIIFDMQWLGIGRVRVGFDIRGVKSYAHEFDFANEITLPPYMRSASLPVRYSVKGNPGLSGNADLTAVCSAVLSEGGLHDIQGFPFHAHQISSATAIAALPTITPILAIRPTLTFGGQPNRVYIAPKRSDGLNVGVNPVHFFVIYGATITGGSWAAVNATYSAMEQNLSPTGFSGGIHIDGYFITSGQGNSAGAQAFPIVETLPLALDIDGAHPATPLTDTVLIAAAGLGGASSAYGMITWSELR